MRHREAAETAERQRGRVNTGEAAETQRDREAETASET